MRSILSRRAAISVWGVVLSALALGSPATAAASEAIPGAGPVLALPGSAKELALVEGLAVAPIGSFGRSAVPTDLVLRQMADGTLAAPREGAVVGANEKGEPRAWARVKAGPEGWIEDRALAGGWLHVAVDSARARTMILEATGFYVAWIGGEPRGGEKYGADWVRHPVRVAAGRNEFLFKGERGRFRGRLVEPPAPVFFTDADETLPDLAIGDAGPWWAGLRLVNATGERLTGIEVMCAPEGAVSAKAGPLDVTVAPFTTQKMAVPVALAKAPSSEGPVRLTVRAKARAGRSTVETPPFALELKAVASAATHSRTFVSAIDRSVQYFGVVPPSAGRASASGPAAGAKPALVLTLHGASVEGIGQARAYTPKDWAVIAAATNRRPCGFDWEDWGRLDALEVMAEASRVYGTDPSRAYLTGHSMGGHGTWQVGASAPDLWAAIAPSAGWRSFSTYGAGTTYPDPTPVEAMLARANDPGETEALARNFLHYGVYVLHGDQDDNVPVTEARAMRQLLGGFHPDFAYYERPGAGHWWGNECVDWPPLFDFLKGRVRPANGEARRVEFVTANPGVASRSRWLEILSQVHPLAYSRAIVERDEKGTSFKGTTENVRRLAIDVPEGGAGAEAGAGAGETVTIELDGSKVEAKPAPGSGARIFLRRAGDRWAADAAPSPALKNPVRSGGFKDAFRHGVVFVYGTRGDAAEDARSFGKARFDAELFWARGNNGIEVIPDTAFDAARFKDRGVILYGNADTNSAWPKLLAGSPVDVRNGRAAAGGRTWTGPDLAALFVRPRPGSDVASVGAVAWTGRAGWVAASPAQYFISGAGFPDFMILGADALRSGTRGVRALGWFGEDWTLEAGDAAFAEK